MSSAVFPSAFLISNKDVQALAAFLIFRIFVFVPKIPLIVIFFQDDRKRNLIFLDIAALKYQFFLPNLTVFLPLFENEKSHSFPGNFSLKTMTFSHSI